MGLFGKSSQKDPKEQVNEWCHKLRKEGNQLERQINTIKREEEKVKRTLKESAKNKDKDTCIILAKELIRSKKAISRIHTSKAHLNSVQLQMKSQLATLRVAGALSKSTEVMQAMQALVRLPEIATVMQEMSREMLKAGILEEMMDESMEYLDESEDMEEEAQSEIDKVLWEITAGKLGEAPLPPQANVTKEDTREEVSDADENEEELEEMQSRLQALRS